MQPARRHLQNYKQSVRKLYRHHDPDEMKPEHYRCASVIFRTISKNTQVNIMPFIMVVVISAHHIPRISNTLLLKMIASGMRSDVKVILITLHRRVLPSPDNAPTVIISTHKNASLNPTMIK